MSTVLLSTLRAGTEATVAEVLVPEQAQDQELVMRLVEIGFMPGERVRVIARGQPGDDPIAVRIGHTTFALRRFEAAFVKVTLPGQETNGDHDRDGAQPLGVDAVVAPSTASKARAESKAEAL